MTAEASDRPTGDRPLKSERLDLRVSHDQKVLFEGAAAATARSVTQFVVQSAVIAARDVLADRTRFELPQERWAAFAEAIDREPRYLPRLAALLTQPSVLDRE